jgi:hypothetical protein
MQTFLPYKSFEDSARCLDYRRLGKQRVEARQIYNAIRNKGGWFNHPVVKMWVGYENALLEYSNVIIREWIRRGFKNTMMLVDIYGEVKNPLWLGDEVFHSAHRSNLLRKDFDYYSKFNWHEPLDLPYVWPIGDREKDHE